MRLGIDLGGTKIAFGLLDEDGKILYFEKIETEKDKGYDHVKEKILDTVIRVLSINRVKIEDLTGIGIACAGQIDVKTGIIKFSPNLKWENVPIGKDIESFFSVRTFVENDVNAATYGEWKFSFGGKPENVIGVFLGTGVGGGIIADRKLFRGSGFGGEIGHMILNPRGYPCNCGSRGCFEAFCGGDYIIGRVKRLLDEGYVGKIGRLLTDGEPLKVSHVEKAYYLGDRAVKGIWEEVIEYLGCALTNIANIFNPDLIIVGGGVIKGSKKLLKEAKKIVEQRAMPESKRNLIIEASTLGDAAAILGVAFLS